MPEQHLWATAPAMRLTLVGSLDESFALFHVPSQQTTMRFLLTNSSALWAQRTGSDDMST